MLKTSGLKVSHYFTVCGDKALSGVGESLDWDICICRLANNIIKTRVRWPPAVGGGTATRIYARRRPIKNLWMWSAWNRKEDALYYVSERVIGDAALLFHQWSIGCECNVLLDKSKSMWKTGRWRCYPFVLCNVTSMRVDECRTCTRMLGSTQRVRSILRRCQCRCHNEQGVIPFVGLINCTWWTHLRGFKSWNGVFGERGSHSIK